MSKKKITRKEFISKTSKCAGGLICTPIILSVFQSCNKPDPVSFADDDTLYISECPCHQAQFDQDGNVVQNPNTGQEIEPLVRYTTTDLNENSFTITDEDNNEIEIPLAEHTSLQNIGGVSLTGGTEFDSKGLLLYRKSQTEIIALSRECTHNGCAIDAFEDV